MTKRKSKAKTAEMNSKQSLSYEGKVTVKIQRSGKTISSKTYHNSGRLPLFKFLCNCLAGVYSEQNRPAKIKLFNYDYASAGKYDPAQFNWDNDINDAEVVTPFVTYTSSPVIKEEIATPDGTKENAYNVTYHFKINDTYISGEEINVIAIYGTNVVDQKNDACAYFVLKKKKDGSSDEEWDPIRIQTTGSYSIIIEWTMKVSNK